MSHSRSTARQHTICPDHHACGCNDIDGAICCLACRLPACIYDTASPTSAGKAARNAALVDQVQHGGQAPQIAATSLGINQRTAYRILAAARSTP